MAFRPTSQGLSSAVNATLGESGSDFQRGGARKSWTDAIARSQAWQDAGSKMVSQQVGSDLQGGFDLAAWGINATASEQAHEQRLKAIKEAQEDSERSGIFGAIGSAASLIPGVGPAIGAGISAVGGLFS